MKNKVCSFCRQIKPLSSFWKDKTKTDGRACQCKACRSAQQKEHRKLNPDMYRKKHLKHLFGLTIEAYKVMLESQGGVCCICGGVNRNGEWLSVDHDHITGEIRGILCATCNTAIGNMHDSPVNLRKAADYLDGR